MYDVIIIGGGAAGMFSALAAKTRRPHAQILLLEKTATLLAKVKISGGGRCNVTHACFDPKTLTNHYPRGHQELLGPFHHFQPLNTIEWFESRGTFLKTEEDGRMFPTTDDSETIIHTLLNEAQSLELEIRLKQHITAISSQDGGFLIELKECSYTCKNLILATGSNPQGWAWAKQLGHTIQSPVPSLFTFNIPSSPLKELSGIAVETVTLSLPGFNHTQTGPLLITHFGFSGPVTLKLSAWAARFLNEKQYRTPLLVNWLPDLSKEEVFTQLSLLKKSAAQKTLGSENPFKLPKNLWKTLLQKYPDQLSKNCADLSVKFFHTLAEDLHQTSYLIEGKTTHKEEFVTCGGIVLKEIHFKTMASKICPHLFFAGEILDVDGVTGGFNFQNAWTTGFLAGSSAADTLLK
jgi:predicted Rossmann fold flavoprotein